MEEGEIPDQYTEHLEAPTTCILTQSSPVAQYPIPSVPFHVHTSISLIFSDTLEASSLQATPSAVAQI